MRDPYRPPPKKNPVNQYRGAVARAQGKRFESYIDASLKYYQQQGLAIVEKTPEPMRPTKDLGNGKFIAFLKKRRSQTIKGRSKEAGPWYSRQSSQRQTISTKTE